MKRPFEAKAIKYLFLMEWKCLAKTFLDQALCSRVRAFSFRAGWGCWPWPRVIYRQWKGENIRVLLVSLVRPAALSPAAGKFSKHVWLSWEVSPQAEEDETARNVPFSPRKRYWGSRGLSVLERSGRCWTLYNACFLLYQGHRFCIGRES